MEELFKNLMGETAETTGEPGTGEGSPQDGGGMDPRMLVGMLELMEAFTGEEDADRLIAALRPFVSRERAESIDEALRVMKLVRTARVAMKLWSGQSR